MIKKPDGTWRPCVDYRVYNSNTKSLNFSMPEIQAMLRKFANKKYFSCFDMRWAYHHLKIHTDTQKSAAFITHLIRCIFAKTYDVWF